MTRVTVTVEVDTETEDRIIALGERLLNALFEKQAEPEWLVKKAKGKRK